MNPRGPKWHKVRAKREYSQSKSSRSPCLKFEIVLQKKSTELNGNWCMPRTLAPEVTWSRSNADKNKARPRKGSRSPWGVPRVYWIPRVVAAVSGKVPKESKDDVAPRTKTDTPWIRRYPWNWRPAEGGRAKGLDHAMVGRKDGEERAKKASAKIQLK